MANARELFERELQSRQFAFSIAEDGRYRIESGDGGTLLVSLDNIAREFERDRDAALIERFVDRVLSPLEVPGWERARSQIYWSAERFDNDFGDTLRETVSDTVTRVLIVTDLDHGIITWLTPTHLEKWSVSPDELKAVAGRNLDELLAGKQLELSDVGDGKLGMIPVGSALKASCIFAPAFERFVAPLGWPVLVVIPSGDFAFVIAEADQHLLPRIGPVVQEEFRTSGYPITTEVLRVSDGGIEAIGAFPE